MKIKLLDCTLRDGGYYNNWDFNEDLVTDYLSAIADSGTDYIELGLRRFSSDSFLGASAFTTHQYLDRLNLPAGPEYGVMIDAKTILSAVSDKFSHEAAVDTLFKDRKDEHISLVRVAAHFDELKDTPRMLHRLKEKGYKVGLNIMQSSLRSSDELSNATKEISRSNSVDVLYFADSLGSMDIRDVERVFEAIRKEWNGEIGFHSHNNMGQALENVNKAIEIGASWIDGTISGMGRGAGNAETEYLLANPYLQKDPSSTYKIFNLVSNHFAEMKKKCGWGPSLEYFYGAKFGIHPTYIQEMLSDSRYSEEDIISVIEHLQKEGGKKFSSDNMEGAKHFLRGEVKGTWSPKDIFQKNDVLILGGGNGIKKHKSAIEAFIKKNKPIVLALNTQSGISSEFISYRIASHPVRLLADLEAHLGLEQPLITPISMLPDALKEALKGKKIMDYGLSFDKAKFEFEEKWCTTPSSLVIAYALAAARAGEARHIFMAGFDGYPAGDDRNSEIQKIIHKYNETIEDSNLIAITPTRIKDLQSKSVYAL